ncbi:hypothetical protein [Bacillus sp. FJAT-45350]|uniref:hypothetical protein n=1 Tax=Bacillus sp. FJAT-45350 TaxID=2011014 RepID=UPI000BB75EA6|nr:hypothetical protein [Bacillus sp. FJAT-45350]
MFELYFEFPVIWMIIGMLFLYVVASMTGKMLYDHCNYNRFLNEKKRMPTIVRLTELPLIANRFTYLQRKIPSKSDKSHSDDEEGSLLYYFN